MEWWQILFALGLAALLCFSSYHFGYASAKVDEAEIELRVWDEANELIKEAFYGSKKS